MLTDTELDRIRPISGTYAMHQWIALYGWILERPVTSEDVERAHQTFWSERSGDLGATWADVIRSTDTPFRRRL